jgi:hypothetical protein
MESRPGQQCFKVLATSKQEKRTFGEPDMDELSSIHSHRLDFGRRDLIRLAGIAAIAATPTTAFAQAGKADAVSGTQFANAGHPVIEAGCGNCTGCAST